VEVKPEAMLLWEITSGKRNIGTALPGIGVVKGFWRPEDIFPPIISGIGFIQALGFPVSLAHAV
jgi:hypothetical protein